jgi:hypothetical protein
VAELLVRIVPHLHPNGFEVLGRARRGQVLAIMPDGYAWSTTVRGHAAWMIVAIPGVEPDALSRLLELYTDEEKALIESGIWDGKLLTERQVAWKLDIDAVLSLLAGHVFPRPAWSIRWRCELFNLCVLAQNRVTLGPRRDRFSLLTAEPVTLPWMEAPTPSLISVG